MNHNFHYRMIKARVAETIIKELFLVSGYNVFDYGMERSLPTITGRLNRDNSETALQIRKMPDFVVQAPPPGNELFYVEVKYRKNSQFPSPADDIKNYPYTNAWFIVVSQKDIRCISHAQILSGKKITAPDCLLEDSGIFNLPKETVLQFREYATRFFEGVR
jgi:hypothetical protein